MNNISTMGRNSAALEEQNFVILSHRARSLCEYGPLGFDAGDDNLYRFVGNDPESAMDPTGLAIIKLVEWRGERTMFLQIPDGLSDEQINDIVNKYNENPNNPRPGGVGGPGRWVLGTFSDTEFYLTSAADGDKDTERQLVLLLNWVERNGTRPNISMFGLGRTETFGSHCFRWTNNLEANYISKPPSYFGDKVRVRKFILKYPGAGGPEHSILLVKIGNGDNLMGLDNGSLNGLMNNSNPKNPNYFSPYSAMSNPLVPTPTQADIQAAVNSFKNPSYNPTKQ